MRTLRGRIFYQIFSAVHLLVLVIILLCYTIITIYIHRTASRVQGNSSRYMRSVRSMMAYVFAFLFQWWPMGVITFWSFLGDPAEWFIVLSVVIINLGPCYTAFAYYYLRRQIAIAKQRERNSRRSKMSKTVTETSISRC